MTVLLLKLFLAPSLVVGSTLAGRRWGPHVAGILVGLPIVAGPILFITFLGHGRDFAADAAASSLLGLVSLAALVVVFAHGARRFGTLVTLAISWCAVLAIDAALSLLHLNVALAFALTLAATIGAGILMPTKENQHEAPAKKPRWDLTGRALATAVLVLTVTTASGALGPRWTGLLAPFPIATSVVAAFVHAQAGAHVTAKTLAGTLTGLFSFATFCLTLSLLVRPLGAVAFAVAAAVTVIAQLLAVRLRD
ncbi:hypothetical protein AB5J62_18535 [Amycolatopsis sp. cg5]|uniref:hypothetical protein n=1 Tax=Amycolatopsis sp. cg5 TaxID=3238802 RepID=UPI003523BD5B